LILNKLDLLDLRFKNKIAKRLEDSGINKVIFIDSLNPNTKVNGFSEVFIRSTID
jgi:ribosome biogenesis GTPase A